MNKIQEIFNFHNIGSKIKNLVKWFCWITILLLWIATPILIIAAIASDGDSAAIAIVLFPVAALVASAVVWVSCWVMYALGEFVEDTHAMRNKECPEEQMAPAVAPPKQEVCLATPTEISKSAKVFSILAGIFVLLGGLALKLDSVTRWFGYRGFPTLLCFAFVLLAVFLFKRSKKGIVAGWAFLVGVMVYGLSVCTYHMTRLCLAALVVYLLFMLLTIFQKKLIGNKIVRVAVFLLPIAYAYEWLTVIWWGSRGQVCGAVTGLGMVFYLLYLMKANSVKKTDLPKEPQTNT